MIFNGDFVDVISSEEKRSVKLVISFICDYDLLYITIFATNPQKDPNVLDRVHEVTCLLLSQIAKLI